MSLPKPDITISVDITNPGQFFACCGLLELSDRLWPGAEGWFEDRSFHIRCQHSLGELLEAFAGVELCSSLTPEQVRLLGTLMSKDKNTLTPEERDEKIRLREMWRFEQLRLTEPFDLWIDWWRDERGERTMLKTWAAKMMVWEMANSMFRLVREQVKRGGVDGSNLFFVARDDSLPFNFDSDLSRMGSARDAGFSMDTLELKTSYRPLLELLAFVGLQRFQPRKEEERFIYCAWRTPLPPSVAAVAASGTVALQREPRFSFGLFHRTKYMKAFLPAIPM